MLSHPFESFIFIEKALLDLIRWGFIIFYCSAYVWRKIWANMLVHVFLKLPHIEPHSLEFLPDLVSLPSALSPLYCPPHYCIRFLIRIPRRRPLCPLCSGASLLLAPFLGMLQTHLTLHLPLPTKGYKRDPLPPSTAGCSGAPTPVVHLFLTVQAMQLWHHCCVVSGYCCWLLISEGFSNVKTRLS